MNRPRVLIAAPASGSGKTMLTCGLLQALVSRGLKVSSFKCGPDYIDPMFHQKVIGARSGSLDLFFADGELLRWLFCSGSENTDISVVEGVMGYYDGVSAASDAASSKAVAAELGAPVVLVVDAAGQSMSALATLEGFLRFRPDSGIRGVIFNRMTESVYSAVKPLAAAMGVLPLGYVPKCAELVIESRHLGLVTPDEVAGISERLRGLAALMEKTVDIDGLLGLAKSAPPVLCREPELPAPAGRPRVAVARDQAFCFLYRDNMTLLEKMGAEPLYFSPLRDEKLPEGAQGLLLCGGYPELYAGELAENTSMRRAIGAAAASMPCLAECGGFMYLHRALEDMEGRRWPMAGVIDADAVRTDSLRRFGYVTLSPVEDTAFFRRGESVRGHEFHYYESGSVGGDMEAVKPVSGRSWRCMHAHGTLLAGFPHLFYYSNPTAVCRFLDACAGKSRNGN